MHVKSRIMRLPLATNRRQLFLAMSGLTDAMAWPQRAGRAAGRKALGV